MNRARIVVSVVAVFVILITSCEDATSSTGPKDEPSTLTLEQIQMAQPLSGGIFDSGYTLTRTVREYPPENEDNVFGDVMNLADGYSLIDEDHFVLTIYGFARDDHPMIDSFMLRVPTDTAGTFTYDPATDSWEYPRDTWLELKTTYGVWLTAGEETQYDTSLSVTITELSDRWVEGSFTADLIYFNVTEPDDGGIQKTIDTEITNRQLTLNGSFRVYR